MGGKEATREMLKVFSNYEKANDVLINKWQEIIVFTPRWWLGIILGILPWFLWIKFHNKRYTGDLLRAGFFMATLCLILDGIGVQIGLWMYVYDIFPFIPGYFPWDLTLLPIITMTFIEIFPKWNPLYKALIYAILIAFIGEPLADYSKIYEPLIWKYYYSVPIYILLFLLCNKVAKSKIFNAKF